MATTTAPAPQATPLSTIPGVQTTKTDPANDLRGQTIGIAPTANRLNIANSYLDNWNSSTQPQFQADLNSATSNAAATGKLGSGGLRTSLGDLTYNRDLQRNTQASNFYNDALNGSIADNQFNVGQANQQQQYQTGLQNQTFNQGLATQQAQQSAQNQDFNQGLATTQQANATQAQQFGQGVTQSQLAASLQNQGFNQNLATTQQSNATQAQQFGQGVTQAQLQDSLTNSGFNRAATTYQIGQQGNPSSAYQNLANQYGTQASQGQAALSGLINNTSANNSAQSNNQLLQQLLAQYGLGGNITSQGASLPESIYGGDG